jgi:hypothetical protein
VEKNINPELMLEKVKETNRHFLKLKPLLEAIAVDQEIKQLPDEIKRRWKIIRYTRLGEVKKALKSQNIHNMILVSHARSNGQLVDSEGQAYPLSFFHDLSPSLYSLTLYSCYSKEAVKLYRLKENIQTASVYPNRKLFYVKDVRVQNKESLAPISKISNFVRKIDFSLSEDGIEPLVPYSSLANKRCKVEIEGVPQNTRLTATLNGQFLGIITQRENQFNFPCGLAIKDQNTLFLRPFASKGLTRVNEFVLKFQSQKLLHQSQRFTSKGLWIGEKILFSKID